VSQIKIFGITEDMKNSITLSLTLCALLVPGIGFAKTPKIHTSEQVARQGKDFRSYWYRGLAELNRYELQQVRYGEVHPGEVVLIFVTEDFLTDKQVKHEFGPRKNAVSVLKSHQHRRFWTGVYPYHIHTSTFVPVDQKLPSQKLAFTATEWCGVVYSQVNRTATGLRARLHSYFQAEGDQDLTLPAIEMEDALWSRARIDPKSLPTGKIDLLPAMHYLRMLHKPIEALEAFASLEEKASLLIYTLRYPKHDREVRLEIESTFPHRITAFQETYRPLGSTTPATTRGELKKSVMLDYWARHTFADTWMRGDIGLMP